MRSCFVGPALFCYVLIFSYIALSLLCICRAVFLLLPRPLICASFFAGASYLYSSSSGPSDNSLSAYYSLFCAELVRGSGPNHGIASCSSMYVRSLLPGYICKLGSPGKEYAPLLIGGYVLFFHFLVVLVPTIVVRQGHGVGRLALCGSRFRHVFFDQLHCRVHALWYVHCGSMC